MMGGLGERLSPPIAVRRRRSHPGASAAPGRVDPLKGTMLGVAVPGIAPIAASAPPRGLAGTMMGVAVPGIAPVHPVPSPGGAPIAAGVASAVLRHARWSRSRPSLHRSSTTSPTSGPSRAGSRAACRSASSPASWRCSSTAAGTAVFFLLRSTPLVVQPGLDAQGHEQLHLRCETCPDGTVAELDGAHATFQNKEADLALGNPLKVGNNSSCDPRQSTQARTGRACTSSCRSRPRSGLDLSDPLAVHPAILVRVEAVTGTTVEVDGKHSSRSMPATRGSTPTDITSETEGGVGRAAPHRSHHPLRRDAESLDSPRRGS